MTSPRWTISKQMAPIFLRSREKETWMLRHLANAKLPVIHLSASTDMGRLGLEAENPSFWPLGQRKIGYIALKPERLSYVTAQPMGLLARFKADPPFKSP